MSEEIERALDVARWLVSIGVPVFVAPPAKNGDKSWNPAGGHNGCGYWIPPKWPTFPATMRGVDAWRPGLALCAVMGHMLDLVDLDTRNGADPTSLNGTMPTFYAKAVTPSDGLHYFVATMGVRSRDGVFPGIDIKAGVGGQGHGFAFIAPTIRLSKTTGEAVSYRWDTETDVGELEDIPGDRSGEKLAEIVRLATTRKPGPAPAGQSALGTIPIGQRDGTLFEYARELWSRNLSRSEVEALMQVRWAQCEQSADHPYSWEDALAKIESGRQYPMSGVTVLAGDGVPWQPSTGSQAVSEPYSAADDDGSRSGAVIVTLADVVPERITWLWDSRLPAGKLVMLDGDPGAGKSTLTLDWAARVSCGKPWPDGATSSNGAGDVLMMSAEDGLADTISPRLVAAGADRNRVHALTEVDIMGDDGRVTRVLPTLPRDIRRLETEINRRNVRLAIVDVFMAYLSADVKSFSDQDVRSKVLTPLGKMAERTGCTIVLLRHLNKSGGSNALYRGGGSIGILGASRAAYIVAPDPDDDKRMILASNRMSVAADPSSLAYRIVEDEQYKCGRIEWEDGAVDLSASDLVSEQVDGGDRSKMKSAKDFLTDVMSANRCVATKDLEEEAKERYGIAYKTLERARQELNTQAHKTGKIWYVKSPGWPCTCVNSANAPK